MTESNVSSVLIGSRRVKKAGAALALAMAVTLGGIALAAPANAATLGTRGGHNVLANGSSDTSAACARKGGPGCGRWGEVQNAGKDWVTKLCKSGYPTAKSAVMIEYTHQLNTNDYYSVWECRDTP